MSSASAQVDHTLCPIFYHVFWWSNKMMTKHWIFIIVNDSHLFGPRTVRKPSQNAPRVQRSTSTVYPSPADVSVMVQGVTFHTGMLVTTLFDISKICSSFSNSNLKIKKAHTIIRRCVCPSWFMIVHFSPGLQSSFDLTQQAKRGMMLCNGKRTSGFPMKTAEKSDSTNHPTGEGGLEFTTLSPSRSLCFQTVRIIS